MSILNKQIFVIDTSVAKPVRFQILRGEAVEVECQFRNYGIELDLDGMSAMAYWRTKEMEEAGLNAWYSSDLVEVDGNKATWTWGTDNDAGAEAYQWFLKVDGSDGTSYRAFGLISMCGSPAGNPSVVPIPTTVLDFDKYTVINAPWEEEGWITSGYLADRAVTPMKLDRPYVEVIGDFDGYDEVTPLANCEWGTSFFTPGLEFDFPAEDGREFHFSFSQIQLPNVKYIYDAGNCGIVNYIRYSSECTFTVSDNGSTDSQDFTANLEVSFEWDDEYLQVRLQGISQPGNVPTLFDLGGMGVNSDGDITIGYIGIVMSDHQHNAVLGTCINNDIEPQPEKVLIADDLASIGKLATMMDLAAHKPPVDANPTSGSANAVSSNGVYTALQLKFDKAGGTISGSVVQGDRCTATGSYSYAGGLQSRATGNYSHAEGHSSIASGNYSHAEGVNTSGQGATASGDASHAEGASTTASGIASHAEGGNTTASGQASHAEGSSTIASGSGSHAEGSSSIAAGTDSHAAGWKAVTAESGGGDNAIVNPHLVAWAWQGVMGDYYHSHGNGTFNINPVGGLDGVYIGEVKLSDSFLPASHDNYGEYYLPTSVQQLILADENQSKFAYLYAPQTASNTNPAYILTNGNLVGNKLQKFSSPITTNPLTIPDGADANDAVARTSDLPPFEVWTFVLSDNTTVTKKVAIYA